MTNKLYGKNRKRPDQPIGFKPELKLTAGEQRLLNTEITAMSAIEHERQEIREKTERLRKLRLDAKQDAERNASENSNGEGS